MNFGRGWVFLVPLLVFVITGMILSCGGGGGSASATPGPPGPSILDITICEGAAPLPTPFPTTGTPTPTVLPTLCTVVPTPSIPQGCLLQLHAVAELNNGTNSENGSTIDVTNSSSANWTSSDSSALLPTTIQGNQGLYMGVTVTSPGENPPEAVVSIPGLSSLPVAVMVSTPLPSGTPCPSVVLIPPTPVVTPSP